MAMQIPESGEREGTWAGANDAYLDQEEATCADTVSDGAGMLDSPVDIPIDVDLGARLDVDILLTDEQQFGG